MNIYYIQVIIHSGTAQRTYDKQIRAKSLRTASNAGYYCFYGEDDKPMAYYPIVNTIISRIDYGK